MLAFAAVEALSALAHEHRLAIYRLLVQAGPEGLSAGAIAGEIGIPASSFTFHVQQLHRAGLITQQRVSRQIFYAADFAVMNGLLGYLTENCCASSGGSCAKPVASARVGRRKRSIKGSIGPKERT